ncbi:MAG TPA: FAD:protein FMN transferase [Burkholderiales bacterium]|jgi:thiamine biosynthesis lipoprotein|nr:FAD:protein FMN transferase [Burkholderiales bacterium]
MNRRARPLLGTFVEISAWGGADDAISRAFGAIAQLEKQLSFHVPASELSQLNRNGHATIGTHLRHVLAMALRIARLSGGAFDPSSPRGSWRDIELLSGARVRFKRALCVDLGGIAKGYCVDRAVAELRRAGVESGLVNAGGDLRAFGARAFPLHLRHPEDSRRLLPLGELRNAALATSATYLRGQDRCAGAAPLVPGASVSVRARRAAIADALTKVVAVMGERAAPVLARYRAQAWIVAARERAAA